MDIMLPELIAKELKGNVDLIAESAEARERYDVSRRECETLAKWCMIEVIPGDTATKILMLVALEINTMWTGLIESYHEISPCAPGDERKRIIERAAQCSQIIFECIAIAQERTD